VVGVGGGGGWKKKEKKKDTPPKSKTKKKSDCHQGDQGKQKWSRKQNKKGTGRVEVKGREQRGVANLGVGRG